MNSLNSLIVEGRLVKDATLKDLPSGLKVGEMTIAVNRGRKDSDGNWIDEVSYFEVSSFGKMAEVSADKGKKGTEIRVVGRLKQERWNGPDGKSNSKVVIVAEHIDYRESEKKQPVENTVQEDVEIPVETGFNIGF